MTSHRLPLRRLLVASCSFGVAGCAAVLGIDDLPIDSSPGGVGGLASGGGSHGGSSTGDSSTSGPSTGGAATGGTSGGGAGAGGACGMAYRDAVMADAPEAYYRLDEASGVKAFDETTHQLDGTYDGVVTLGVAGAICGDTAASFDGTDGYVNVGNVAPALGFVGTSPFTIEAWIKLAAVGADQTIVANFNGSEGYELFVEPGGLIKFRRWGAASFDDAVSPSAPADDAYHHVVALYNQTKMLVFLDAAAGPSMQSVSPINYGAVAVFTIGASANGTARYFHGAIDEVAIYPTALSIPQIQAHYAAAKP